ncbi:MAG: hypothetical protein ACI8W7_001447 [Gammaproteobacteria bacterium]|jgi:hypothetical protein
MRSNPLVVETLHGITRPGRAQMDYLLYLFVLAAVVFVWWPKHTLTQTLQRQDAPDTLLAALLVCGAILAYYSARAGAEEFLLEGQHGLRDWAIGTELALARILRGYVAAHLLHSVHLIALSLPIMLLAFHISGGQWPALLLCLVLILCQAMFYKLAAAVIYIAIGHHGALNAISIRAFIVAIYLASTFSVPFASHIVLTSRVLDGGSSAHVRIDPSSAPAQFMALYIALSACAFYILYRQLSRLRTEHSSEATSP